VKVDVASSPPQPDMQDMVKQGEFRRSYSGSTWSTSTSRRCRGREDVRCCLPFPEEMRRPHGQAGGGNFRRDPEHPQAYDSRATCASWKHHRARRRRRHRRDYRDRILPDDLREMSIRTFRKRMDACLRWRSRSGLIRGCFRYRRNQTLAAQISHDRVSLWRKLKRHQLDLL